MTIGGTVPKNRKAKRAAREAARRKGTLYTTERVRLADRSTSMYSITASTDIQGAPSDALKSEEAFAEYVTNEFNDAARHGSRVVSASDISLGKLGRAGLDPELTITFEGPDLRAAVLDWALFMGMNVSDDYARQIAVDELGISEAELDEYFYSDES